MTDAFDRTALIIGYITIFIGWCWIAVFIVNTIKDIKKYYKNKKNDKNS